ncbi:MAG: helix-turn-helix domain-containing protein [Planctomycetes bacterium]|nr:helix-turn-helix domain-containing protein [Planctomycetota bacterium]
MSNRKIYRIRLTADERAAFEDIIKGKRGKVKIAAWKVQRANAMLKCDESEQGPAWADEKIADAFATTTRSLENWRKKAALEGPLSLLERKERSAPPTPPILDGEKEAQLTKIACSEPLDGRSRWTLQMLAEQL